MAGPIFKGYAGVTVNAEEPFYDAETDTLVVDVTYKGARNAIFDVGNDLQAQGVSYQCSQDGPVYSLRARLGTNIGVDTPPDRYEISTEAQDKSIFEHPSAIQAANEYDSALTSDGAETWREVAEKAVSERVSGATSGVIGSVIRHLRTGVTGWQVDFIVLRRFRQVSLEYAQAAGKITLDDGQYIYTTAQLALPETVYFNLPTTPSDPSDDYSWGWRKRGQRVEIVGNFAEQTVELVFAPWSTFLYSNASGNLSW